MALSNLYWLAHCQISLLEAAWLQDYRNHIANPPDPSDEEGGMDFPSGVTLTLDPTQDGNSGTVSPVDWHR